MGYGRRIAVYTQYEGKDISDEITHHMEEVTYTDVASGESDSVSVKLEDRDKTWMDAWYPQKGDRMVISTVFCNWYAQEDRFSFNLGSFQVDDISFRGRPISATIGGAAMPQDNGFNHENKTRTWENTTVQQIGQEIAAAAGISLLYIADSISIKAIEQTNQTDCKFLYSLAESYGLAMKVFADRVVIYEEERREIETPMMTLWESDLLDWSYNTTLAGTYTGAVFSFTDPDDEKEYNVQIGGGDRILNINVTADNIYDAELKGIARLNNENKKATTMSVNIMANPYVVAAITVQIEGLGKLSGKYFVEKVKTKISGSGASTQALTMRKIVPRIKNVSVKAVEEAKEEEKAAGTQYTVVSGDTLWGIAKRFLGAGTRYVEIYNANAEVIESTAKSHGKRNSSNGHWIWQGEVLTIPPK